MKWIETLLLQPSALQTVVVVSMICAAGLALGKVRIKGISLGIAFVFFMGIVAGSVGLSVNSDMLNYCETFGLVLFVYTLGLHVGPNFFGSLRKEGMPFNAWGLAVVLAGTLLTVVLTAAFSEPITDMVGVMCGATTNTPALGAAQQVMKVSDTLANRAALATAVTYPMGVLGVIIVIALLRRFCVSDDDLQLRNSGTDDSTFVGQYIVTNPAIEGKSVAMLAQSVRERFIVSRIWRGKQVVVPHADTQLRLKDNVLVVTNKNDAAAMEMLFGEKKKVDWNRSHIDWNHIDSKVESHVIVLSRTRLNGKRLGELHLREAYGVNVSRVLRGDVKLLATDDLRLQYGDRLTVVGMPKDLEHAEAFLGNSVQTLNEPNLGSIFLGMLFGVALGTIPLAIPGIKGQLTMGVAGGSIIVGILVGALGPRLHFISYTTRSASLMLRKLGLALYLACLGLDAGDGFLSTVMRPEGLLWVATGAVITIVPLLLLGWAALKTHKMDFGTICGILCGAMANPMALSYATDTIREDTPSIAYATVYPAALFLRVVIAQMLVMACM